MQATCEVCKQTFEAKRSTAKYCTRACSARATRQRAVAASSSPPAAPAETPPARSGPPEGGEGVSLLVAATLDELRTAGRLSTALGQAALVLAEKAGSRNDTGSATASVIRQLQATLAAALAGAAEDGDPVDELEARRRSKASSA